MQKLSQIFSAIERQCKDLHYSLYNTFFNHKCLLHWLFVLPPKFGLKLGDGLGRIICYNHGIGGILHFTRSDGFILIV